MMHTKLEYKVLFHIDQCDVELLDIAIKNAENLIADVEMPFVKIAFVTNYIAPKLFLKNALEKEMVDSLTNLAKNQNVSIYVCNNSLKNLNIVKSELLNFCEVVPAGITKIIELQSDGFAYIKP